jgi:phosphomannomutase
MTAKINFGTSGWRAIIADEFTFANVRLTAEAIGRYVKTQNSESAGLSIRGHVPEKDGIPACLLIAEMFAGRGKSLKNQLKDLFSRVGAVYNRRLNVKLDPAISARVKAKIARFEIDF